jgi:hypothetical protein
VGLLKSKGRIETAKDRVRPLAETASQKVGPVAGQVRDHLGPAMGTAREKVSPYAEKAVERGATVAQHAVEKAGPVIDDVLGKVGPAAEQAAEKARERFNDDVLPKVTAALVALAAAAEPAVEETSRRGRATKAALKGEIDAPTKKSSHKLRKVVLFLGFGAIVAAVAKKLLTPPEPAWQSTPTSGREYSSSPAGGTTSRYATDKPGTADQGSTAQSDAAAAGTADDRAAGNGATEGKAEVQEKEDTATKSTANGAAQKPTSTTPRRSTGSNSSKPADDA